jgi:transposase
MRPIREILRQKQALGRTHREVARSLGLSLGAISATLARAERSGLQWSAVESLSDSELEARLYPRTVVHRVLPDFAAVHRERQRIGVTLALLHEEYIADHPQGYGYTQFCEHYRRWCRKRRISMRQLHRAGEKLFVDYSGKQPRIFDRTSGAIEVELFVAVLGASNLTYAEASSTQRCADFIASHTRTLEYIGGVPEVVVPDQLKSAVIRACRYEPGLQRTYEEWAGHYGTTVIPARPRKPKDKAKVEVGVQIAQRWILARLRNERPDSLAALNARIAELLEDLNARPMRRYGQSRRERFEQLDRPALRPLPAERFADSDWKEARVNIDYHVEVDRHYYSVPHPLVHQVVDVRLCARTVEIFHRSERVASHIRDFQRGMHSTDPRHMPRAHQKHLEWSPSRLIEWAATVGPEAKALVQQILADRPHPEQGYRSCLGILRLAKRYGRARLEAACARALVAGARSYRSVDTILRRGLDTLPPPHPPTAAPTFAMRDAHENVRGPAYYSHTNTGESHAERTDPRETDGAAPARDGECVEHATGGSEQRPARLR